MRSSLAAALSAYFRPLFAVSPPLLPPPVGAAFHLAPAPAAYSDQVQHFAATDVQHCVRIRVLLHAPVASARQRVRALRVARALKEHLAELVAGVEQRQAAVAARARLGAGALLDGRTADGKVARRLGVAAPAVLQLDALIGLAQVAGQLQRRRGRRLRAAAAAVPVGQTGASRDVHGDRGTLTWRYRHRGLVRGSVA